MPGTAAEAAEGKNLTICIVFSKSIFKKITCFVEIVSMLFASVHCWGRLRVDTHEALPVPRAGSGAGPEQNNSVTV